MYVSSSSSTLPLSLARLEDIQSDCLADDVDIDYERMQHWSEAEATRYFESGGTEAPAAPVDEALAALLTELSLSHLTGCLGGTQFSSLLAYDRASLLSHLKVRGVSNLAERQKLATALLKAQKRPMAVGSVPTGRIAGRTTGRSKPLPPPLPPHRRLTREELATAAAQVSSGAWYGLPIPRSFEELQSPAFGEAWLSGALHAAGTLPESCNVARLVKLHELELSGEDAQGGAGHKAILTVEYTGAAEELAGVHTQLFVKLPWRLDLPSGTALAEQATHYRHVLSSQYGDGDGLELSAYMFLEGLLPVRIPKFYFGDICRASTNYVLITECIPYTPGPPAAATGDEAAAQAAAQAGAILPKCGKYQDHRLPNSADYYFALLRSMARIAAAEKRGALGEHRAVFAGSSGTLGRSAGGTSRVPVDSPARRESRRQASGGMLDILVDFITNVATGLFPPELRDPAFLRRFKAQCVECSAFFAHAAHYVARQPDYAAFTHVNLQIDNGFFWRDEAGALHAGLLDWYNCGVAPFAQVFQGCLSGAEPSVLAAHEDGLMRCFVDEYVREGGPQISWEELRRQWRLLFVTSLVAQIQFIQTDILREGVPRAEWPSIASRDDPRVMGRWNVRCRVISLIDGVGFWRLRDLHGEYMRWVQDSRDLFPDG